MQERHSNVDLLLRIGVAFTFIYPPVSAFFNPLAWIGYFPSFIFTILPFADVTLLHAFGVFEIALGLWILFGKKIFIPSVIATATLLIIIAFNISQIDILFRDFSIVAMSVGLALLHYQKRIETNSIE